MVIQFDTSQIEQDLLLSKDQVQDLMDHAIKYITAEFKDEWQKTADTNLGSSRAEYIFGLNIIDEGPGEGSVVLTGVLPNMVESGASQFDIKTGLLNGPNAKTSKDGTKYNTVPFKMGAPTSNPENFSSILPKEVYNVVKKKSVNPITGRSKGLTKEELPEKFSDAKKVKIKTEKPSKFKEYEHKSSIYEGVFKQKDKVTGQNTYGSFRRVSENSDEDSWIHPGIEARNLMEKALSNFNVPEQVSDGIDSYLKSIGRD